MGERNGSDRQQWPDGPQCFDLLFVSQDMEQEARRLDVDGRTDTSDHQPVLLEI
jgi:exonuclease III